VLLIDTNTWGAAIAAEAWGGPWAVLQHFLTPLPSADVPPFGPGLRPLRGPLGRLRNRALRPVIIGGFERALLPSINALRVAEGLPPLRDVTDFYSRAPLTLYFTSRFFDYPRSSWPAGFRFIGPVVWDPATAAPPWVERISRPVALVTTSSEFQDDGEIVEAALRALEEEDLDVVATMPAGTGRVTAVPANAHVEAWIPHSVLLQRAAVAITHGGMGATQKALAAGVPVVVVPFGRDQLEVGRRVEAAGVGVVLSRRRLTPDSMREAVRGARALSPQAQAFAVQLASEGGARGAADAVEELTARGQNNIPGYTA
jgi:MGT family glycosyltransferase